MTEFSICFTGDIQVRGGERFAVGVITASTLDEFFESNLSFWSQAQYEESWKVALERMVSGESTSCLITNMHNPELANFIITWPLYRIGGAVCVQNQLLFLDQLEKPFVTECPWASVDPHESVDEDGEKISEWFVPVSAVEDFLRGA